MVRPVQRPEQPVLTFGAQGVGRLSWILRAAVYSSSGTNGRWAREEWKHMSIPILDILGIIGLTLVMGIFLVLVAASIRGLWRMIRR